VESSLVCTQFVDICWITITTSPMDRRQDSNAASTSTGKRGPSAQDHDRYCSRCFEGGAKKWRGSGEK